MAADLELDLLGLAVALDPGSYNTSTPVSIHNHQLPKSLIFAVKPSSSKALSSARCIYTASIQKSSGKSRTGGILAPGNFNELLNVGDLARHGGQE